MRESCELRKFSFLLFLMVAGVWSLLLPWLAGQPAVLPGILAGAIIGLVGVAIPQSMRPLRQVLHWWGHWMGRINATLLTGLVFLALVVPMGLLRQALRRRRHDVTETETGSFYQAPEPRDPGHMTRTF